MPVVYPHHAAEVSLYLKRAGLKSVWTLLVGVLGVCRWARRTLVYFRATGVGSSIFGRVGGSWGSAWLLR